MSSPRVTESLTTVKATLSVAMIVRNESLHICTALENLHEFADEIVVLDTGSTDDTKCLAADRGAVVRDFVWCDDFAKARNVSLSYCTQDLVMWLDADDRIPLANAVRLRELLQAEPDWDVLCLPYLYARNVRKMPPRIFRNGIGIHWIYPVHEILNFPKTLRVKRDIDDICVYHSWDRAPGVHSERHLRILEKAIQQPEYRNSSYLLWHIAKEYSGLRERTQAIQYFREAIRHAPPNAGFMLARQYHGLARQYLRLGQAAQAAEAFAKAAQVYPHWREPYCGMADALWILGDPLAAQACIEQAQQIPRHRLTLERSELYDEEVFAKQYVEKARRLAADAALRSPVASARRRIHQNSGTGWLESVAPGIPNSGEFGRGGRPPTDVVNSAAPWSEDLVHEDIVSLGSGVPEMPGSFQGSMPDCAVADCAVADCAVAGLLTEPPDRPEVSRNAGDLRSAVAAGSETRAERERDSRAERENVASEAADPCSALHAQFIDQLARQGYIQNARLLAAFRAVPRHLFLPGIAPAEAYRDVWIPTAQRDGATASSSSRPSFMAVMLDQLDVRPGQCVLEIGAGTAYNAALLSHLAGPTGSLVSIDVDPEIVLAAQDNLLRAGYVAAGAGRVGDPTYGQRAGYVADVTLRFGARDPRELTWFRKDGVSPIGLVCRDGCLGDAEHAPFDRVMVTAGSWDIVPAWREQVVEGGRLLIPLILFPQVSLCVAFEKRQDALLGRWAHPCKFIAMRGPCAPPARNWAGYQITATPQDAPTAGSASAILDRPHIRLTIRPKPEADPT